MKPNKPFLNIVLLIVVFCFFSTIAIAQSFNDEKKSLINYVTRMYTNAPFEGGKKIEGEYTSCAVAIPEEASSTSVLSKAWSAARTAFGEPCVQFENIGAITANNGKVSQLYICQPLSEFIINKFKSRPFDGAKIIQAPQINLLISVVTLENANYPSTSLRDRAATIKARSFVNILNNGSTILSDILIQTETDKNNNVKTLSIESIRELSMGFVGGMSMLASFASDATHSTYIFYSEND